ncbi:hypothetical protein OG883_38600 [Streptomyces sp. NBC_01142]|uniref:hypothetical protein n=1 Tax=Streptomyces sp. NBC_01142 TaxID=2975865 RepID=UPI0022580718|nr:hypothetical protein [Streptomyces sp. NBC_01142]MCX4825659.1 hypothetical protein [Streptomyces sp. NBC_01142]
MEHYQYPPVEADRIDPFDSGQAGSQYVIFGGSRSTYAFADPAKKYDGHLAEWIPMGYMILRHAQKVAVFSHGEVAREWPGLHRAPRVDPPETPARTASPHAATLRELASSHATWLRSVCGYLVKSPAGPATSSEDAYDRAAAFELAAEASRNEGREALWFVHTAENWH